MRDSLVRRITVLCLISLFVALCGVAAVAQEIRVGALLPLSGSLRQNGHEAANALRLAAQQINEQGGLLWGQTLRVIEADDQSHPQTGVTAATALVQDQAVVAIIGSLTSGVTVPVATSVTIPADILLITPGATAPEISYLDDRGLVLRTIPSDAVQGYVLGHLAWEIGLTRLHVVYMENLYGRLLLEAFEGAYRSRGGRIESRVAYPWGLPSYADVLAELGGGEALLVIGYPDVSTTRLLNEAIVAGYTTFLLTEGVEADSLSAGIASQSLEAVWGVSITAHPFHSGTDRFRAAYENAYANEVELRNAAEAYDALFLLALAIEWSGTTDARSVRDALRDVTDPAGEVILPGEWAKAKELIRAGRPLRYEGASGRVHFDRYGDRAEAAVHIWRLNSQGERVTDHVMVVDRGF